MTEESQPQSRSGGFRAAITGFIEARRDAKLQGKDGDAEVASKYEYATWLADAARRVGQIQAVTHVLKASHPDARGSSLHVEPSELPQHAEIGSHLLGGNYAEDIVGNAAALDVFKFLKVEFDGRPLLDWMRSGDPDLQIALSDDKQTAEDWMAAFAALVREEPQPVTHPLAKQIYWLVGEEPQDDAQYHLLQPMFASSLAHAVHADIQDARFGEINKETRQAFRDKKSCETVYRNYRNLAVRKLGGTKPQNISQLNSERRGVNYLLPSLPPSAWKWSRINLLKRESAFDEFFWFEDVRKLVQALADFLESMNDGESTVDIRNRRDEQVKVLAERLALFGATIHAHHEAGWTRDDACRLPHGERLWLDPDRIELPVRDDPDHPEWKEDDLAFNVDYVRGDWADEVAGRFGNWLNAHLRQKGLILMGKAEMDHWARQAVLNVAWPVSIQRRAQGGMV